MFKNMNGGGNIRYFTSAFDSEDIVIFDEFRGCGYGPDNWAENILFSYRPEEDFGV